MRCRGSHITVCKTMYMDYYKHVTMKRIPCVMHSSKCALSTLNSLTLPVMRERYKDCLEISLALLDRTWSHDRSTHSDLCWCLIVCDKHCVNRSELLVSHTMFNQPFDYYWDHKAHSATTTSASKWRWVKSMKFVTFRAGYASRLVSLGIYLVMVTVIRNIDEITNLMEG